MYQWFQLQQGRASQSVSRFLQVPPCGSEQCPARVSGGPEDDPQQLLWNRLLWLPHQEDFPQTWMDRTSHWWRDLQILLGRWRENHQYFLPCHLLPIWGKIGFIYIHSLTINMLILNSWIPGSFTFQLTQGIFFQDVSNNVKVCQRFERKPDRFSLDGKSFRNATTSAMVYGTNKNGDWEFSESDMELCFLGNITFFLGLICLLKDCWPCLPGNERFKLNLRECFNKLLTECLFKFLERRVAGEGEVLVPCLSTQKTLIPSWPPSSVTTQAVCLPQTQTPSPQPVPDPQTQPSGPTWQPGKLLRLGGAVTLVTDYMDFPNRVTRSRFLKVILIFFVHYENNLF